MANPNPSLRNLRINDPVITQVVHGYVQADSIAEFVAPLVPVNSRSGQVIRFDKSNFAVTDTRRSPGTLINRVGTSYTSDRFVLEQHAVAGEVTMEAYEEALNGDAKVDLRQNAALRAVESIAQSWEIEVIDEITNATLYEANNQEVLSGVAQFSDPGSDPERTVQAWKEAVRSQIGIYPNAAVMSTDVFNALKFHPIFRDRVKHTSSGSITKQMLETWLDLPEGIKISQRIKVNPTTGELEDIMAPGTMVLFYKNSGGLKVDNHGAKTIFQLSNGADRARPSFAYTYTLRDYPVAFEERFDPDRLVYLTDIVAEQQIVLTALGANGLCGGGFLATNVVA